MLPNEFEIQTPMIAWELDLNVLYYIKREFIGLVY